MKKVPIILGIEVGTIEQENEDEKGCEYLTIQLEDIHGSFHFIDVFRLNGNQLFTVTDYGEESSFELIRRLVGPPPDNDD